jgi:hypothetical protein
LPRVLLPSQSRCVSGPCPLFYAPWSTRMSAVFSVSPQVHSRQCALSCGRHEKQGRFCGALCCCEAKRFASKSFLGSAVSPARSQRKPLCVCGMHTPNLRIFSHRNHPQTTVGCVFGGKLVECLSSERLLTFFWLHVHAPPTLTHNLGLTAQLSWLYI